jgi:hypothetical protein
MDAEEALAKCNEDGNMEDGLGSQLVQLNPINEEKSPKELVNWDGEAANEEVGENYPITIGRVWSCFITGDLHRPAVPSQAHLLELALIRRGEPGSLPFGDPFLLRSTGGTSGDVPGALGPRGHGG